MPTNLEWAVETAGAMHWAAKRLKRVTNLWRTQATVAVQTEAAVHQWRVWTQDAVKMQVGRKKNFVLAVTHWTAHNVQGATQHWRYNAQDKHAIELPVAHTLGQLVHTQHQIVPREDSCDEQRIQRSDDSAG